MTQTVFFIDENETIDFVKKKKGVNALSSFVHHPNIKIHSNRLHL